jgi:tetratricopeptide (TPR) repeat protein
MGQEFDRILALIADQQFDQARTLINAARNNIDAKEAHRLTALTAVIEIESGNTLAGISLMREAIKENDTWLPHWYRLAVYLMDNYQWRDAIEVLDKLISLSEQREDTYFLDEALFRKIVCLKALGRNAEIEPVRRKIRPGTEVIIGDKTLTERDL